MQNCHLHTNHATVAHLCSYVHALYFLPGQNLQTFDTSQAFRPHTITKLSTLKNSLFLCHPVHDVCKMMLSLKLLQNWQIFQLLHETCRLTMFLASMLTARSSRSLQCDCCHWYLSAGVFSISRSSFHTSTPSPVSLRITTATTVLKSFITAIRYNQLCTQYSRDSEWCCIQFHYINSTLMTMILISSILSHYQWVNVSK